MEMVTKINTRHASIELMRVICMMMIIFHHTYQWFIEETPNTSTIFIDTLDVLNRLTNFHVDAFVLITGYYGIKNAKRTLGKTLKVMLWYLVLTNCISWINGNGFSWQSIVYPVRESPWWFMYYYVWLVLMSPYLNIVCESMNSHRQWLCLLGTVFLFNFYFLWWLTPSFNYYGHNFGTFLMMFFVGRFLHCDYSLIFKNYLLRLGGRYSFAFCAVVLLVVIISILNHFLSLDLCIPDYNSPFSLLMAVTFFLMFKEWNINSRKWIFFLSESAIGVYMLHENPQIIPYLKSFYRVIISYIPHHLIYTFPFLFVVAVYISTCLVDKIRLYVFQKI